MPNPSKPMSPAEKAWEKAKRDIERHDKEFERKHGKK